jgi:hypothetical protein
MLHFSNSRWCALHPRDSKSLNRVSVVRTFWPVRDSILLCFASTSEFTQVFTLAISPSMCDRRSPHF